MPVSRLAVNWNKVADLMLTAVGIIFVLLMLDGIYIIVRFSGTTVADFYFWMPIGVAVTGGIGVTCLFIVYRRRKKRIVKARKD